MIAIQHVDLFWTKDSRGGPAAVRRNAVPRSYPFAPPGPSTTGWLHHIRLSAAEDYAPRETWAELPAEAHRTGVIVQPRGEFAEIRLRIYQQKPHRPQLDGLIARLLYGQRVLIRANTASDGDHQRYYFEHCFQVGFADSATLDLPLFREIDERSILY